MAQAPKPKRITQTERQILLAISQAKQHGFTDRAAIFYMSGFLLDLLPRVADALKELASKDA